nr:phosphatase PAP2 family protein [uncultured Alloprevotella sp.]
MNNRILILTAQVVSLIFSPFYTPVVAFVALFLFSYLNQFPLRYKMVILLMVYFFTVLLPTLSIYIYRRLNGWSRHHLSRRVNRYIPYFLSITCYVGLLYLMIVLHMPHFTLAIIVGALTLQIICAALNNWIKVSTHAAAAGGVVGALCAYSLWFNFNPLSWLCLCILLCGLVGTARLILRQHKLIDIGLGTLLGILCGFFCVLLV